MAAGTVGQEIKIAGLNPASTQGDKAVCAMMERFGVRVEVRDRIVRCCGGELRPAEIDARDIPDMVPALAVTAAFAKAPPALPVPDGCGLRSRIGYKAWR